MKNIIKMVRVVAQPARRQKLLYVFHCLQFCGHREKLKVIGRENDLEKLNMTALRIACKDVAVAYSP